MIATSSAAIASLWNFGCITFLLLIRFLTAIEDTARLRIQEVKQGYEIGVAKVGTYTHVARNGSRRAGCEAFGRGMAAGAILLKDALAAVGARWMTGA